MYPRITIFSLLVVSTIVLTGCGTSSKVDKFLAEADQQIAAKHQLESQSSLSGIIAEQQSDYDPLARIDETSLSDNQSSEAGYYKPYDQTAFTTAQTEGKKIVLMFWSESCASCTSLEQDIVRNPSRIPADTAILRVSYDTSADLVSRYQVTESNTIIILGTDGKELSRTSGGIYRIQDVLAYL